MRHGQRLVHDATFSRAQRLPARTARPRRLFTLNQNTPANGSPSRAHSAALCLSPAPVEPQPNPLCPSGTVPNTAAISKVPEQLLPLLQEATEAITSLFGDRLVGVYLRGSAAQGRYIQGLSDVDLFLVHLEDPNGPPELPASAAAEGLVQDALLARGLAPDVVAKVEVVPYGVPSNSCLGHLLLHLADASPHQVQSDELRRLAAGKSAATGSSTGIATAALAPSDGLPTWLLEDLPCAFLLKSQAACLHGLDLPALLPPTAALPPGPSLDRLGAGIEAALATASCEGGASSGQAVAGLRWALKTCLREAGALAMAQQGVYSRDLYWCCQLAAQQLPKLRPALERALQLYLALDPAAAAQAQVQEAAQEATCLVQQLRGQLYREGLRRMLTPEPDWLPHHQPEAGGPPVPPSSSSGGLLQRLQTLGQLLVGPPQAPAPGATQPPSRCVLLQAQAPAIHVRIAGQVDSYDWSNPEDQAAACRLIDNWSLPLDSVPTQEAAWQLAGSRPLVARGAAASWEAVQQWRVPWLAEQGFEGRVMVAPSLQFPFCEPELAEMLVQAKGPAGPPSTELKMSVAEFVARMRAGPRPAPLVYPAGEYYYMQAELSPQLLAMTRLEAPPFVSGGLAMRQADTGADSASPSGGRLLAQVPRLWLSAGGSVSPLHYDESHSFLVQVHGTKRMLFWPPSHLPYLYPYPRGHLLRRRSRVNLARPDLRRFPLFQQAAALEVVLQPGDVLYFPARWAHHTESVTASVSITCRYRSGTEAAGLGAPQE